MLNVLTLMQKNNEKGRLKNMSKTDMKVRSNAQTAGSSTTLAETKKKYTLAVTFQTIQCHLNCKI